jgi:hypothetical protein
MTEFLVEFYLSRTDTAAFGRSVRRARLAAEKQTRQGTPVRYLRSMYLPDDETCFLLYEAGSAEAARRAAALAAIAFEQVSEVIGDGGDTDAYILTADKREGSMSDGSAQRTDDDRPGASGRCRDQPRFPGHAGQGRWPQRRQPDGHPQPHRQ